MQTQLRRSLASNFTAEARARVAALHAARTAQEAVDQGQDAALSAITQRLARGQARIQQLEATDTLHASEHQQLRADLASRIANAHDEFNRTLMQVDTQWRSASG